MIELVRRAHDADHPDIAVALTNYSSFLHSQGRFAEALSLQAEAVRINRETLMPGSNAALPALNNYGLLLLQTGQIEDARLALSEALEEAGEITQLEQRTPLTIVVNYADVMFTLERYEEVTSTIESKLMNLLRMDDGRIGLPQADPANGLDTTSAGIRIARISNPANATGNCAVNRCPGGSIRPPKNKCGRNVLAPRPHARRCTAADSNLIRASCI